MNVMRPSRRVNTTRLSAGRRVLVEWNADARAAHAHDHVLVSRYQFRASTVGRLPTRATRSST
jgi:hypothetical protein